jgi:hypothetical protein
VRDGATWAAAGLVVDREPGDPSVLRLRGRLVRGDAAALDAAAGEVLAAGRGALIIDIVDLAGDATVVVDVLNGVAAARIPKGAVLPVRVASTAVPFADGSLHPAILVEPMAVVPTATPQPPSSTVPKEEASPGALRREGRGFVASYGTGRRCDAPGCQTKLSRYNERSVCFSHAKPER